jgi:hypothetical protein
MGVSGNRRQRKPEGAAGEPPIVNHLLSERKSGHRYRFLDKKRRPRNRDLALRVNAHGS